MTSDPLVNPLLPVELVLHDLIRAFPSLNPGHHGADRIRLAALEGFLRHAEAFTPDFHIGDCFSSYGALRKRGILPAKELPAGVEVHLVPGRRVSRYSLTIPSRSSDSMAADCSFFAMASRSAGR